MRERKLEHLMGVLQTFLKSQDDEALYVSFVRIALPQVDSWAAESSLPLNDWPDETWLVKRLFTNPPGSVVDHRKQTKEISSLRDTLRSSGKKFVVSTFKKKTFLKKPKQWTLSQEYDRDFSDMFKYDADESQNLFSLCYLAAVNEIDRAVRSQNVIECLSCRLLMLKEGKRTFCSENCRTAYNNRKRDPTKHNEAEKRNRKQRIIKKNAQQRTKR